MTLRIHAPNPIRVGETANVLVTSDNPGVVSLTYGAGLTGPATVTIEGTRVYGNMGGGGDYLARVGAEGANREDVTWLFEIDWGKFPADNDSSANLFTVVPIFGSIRVDVANRSNWQFQARRYNITTISLIYADSLDAGKNSSAVIANITGVTAPGQEKWALTKAAGGAYVLYRASRGTVAASGTRDSTGTMGGTEALIWQSGVSCSKIARVCSDAELDAWFADGTIPAADREFVFSGGHEIDPAAPVIWDTSGNATPLDLTATQITNWQAPGMSVAYTDTDPVVPYAIVPVTAIATTGTTIDATRPRQGVPARASEAERIETADQVTVTVEAEVPPSAIPLTIGPGQTLDALVDEIYLHLTGEDGSVSISSVPAFGLSGLPAVASIVDGVATVTVRRMTAGTYTITATQGTSSASCTITIPSVLVPSDDYDLRLDLADIIEAIQVPANRSAYHYDETMKSDGEALDAEDGTFALHVTQTVDGPIIGGSTAVVLVQVAVESEPDHADMERFREAIHEARCPAYVSSIYCESGDVTPMRGAYLVQYMMQVQLA